MDRERLRHDLQKLHGELRTIQSLEPTEEGLLRQIEADIEALISSDDHKLQPDPEARERLSLGLAQVEASHPRVMLLMRQMVDSLAYLGV